VRQLEGVARAPFRDLGPRAGGRGRARPGARSRRHGHAVAPNRRARRGSRDAAQARGVGARAHPRDRGGAGRHRTPACAAGGCRLMLPARLPLQRPPGAKLAAIDARGAITHGPRSGFAELVEPGDLVVANDAATLPASLAGVHESTGAPIEVRLAQRRSLDPEDVHEFVAVVFGAGDHHVRTEDRAPPPGLAPGDALVLGPARAKIVMRLGHPRLVLLRFEGPASGVWAALARHGRPIQYAHLRPDLALWDVWTPIAGAPAAFEAPSAGFALDWRTLARLRERGIGFATLTHAAGISSTGDAALDRLLPLDEPYRIPEATARAIAGAKERGGRV